MPQAIPLAAGMAAGFGAAAATYGTAALATMTIGSIMTSTAFVFGSMAGSLVVGTIQSKHQQRKAERAARAAYDATLKDRAVMVRSPTEPRRIVYGHNVVSGPVVFMATHGEREYNDHLRLVIALATHRLSAIEDIVVNDHQVEAWTEDEWAYDPMMYGSSGYRGLGFRASLGCA